MAINGQFEVNISAAGDNVVIPAQSGSRIAIIRYSLSLATETTVQFKSGSTALTGPETMLATVQVGSYVSPLYYTARGEAFVISLGGAVQCGGSIQASYTS